MSKFYDVVVLGAGPGGYAAAGLLARAGRTVAIIEEHRVGGVCLNYGCIPAKALLRSAEQLLLARRGDEFGWSAVVRPDYQRAVRRSREVVDTQVNGMKRMLRRGGITVIEGRGTFDSPRVLSVATGKGQSELIRFADCIIATGASAMVPDPFVLGSRITTFRQHIVDEHLPESTMIIGGGPIGLEMADVLSAFGSCVTVVEIADQILPREEPQIGAAVADAFRGRGIEVLTAARVVRAVEESDHVTVTLVDADGERAVEVERVLVATGFVPNSAGLGLDRVGVDLTQRGAIAVDDAMRTSADHIFAIGDVTMRQPLAHVAEAQGRVAARVLLGGPERIADDMYQDMPRVSYMQPQVASVGLREAEAAERYADVRSVVVPFARNAMSHARADTNGFVKLIVHGPHQELAGAHVVGHDVGELLPELVLALRWDLGVTEIADAVHAHPSLGESIQEAVRELAARAPGLS